MSAKSATLRKRERMEVLLPTLVDYYASAKQVKGCSKTILVVTRSHLGKFIKFLEGRGNSQRLADLTLQDARSYVENNAHKTKDSTIIFRVLAVCQPSVCGGAKLL